MYLMTYRISHRLIDVAVLRGIFGNKARTRCPVLEQRYMKSGMRNYPTRAAGGRDLNRVIRLGQDHPPRCARVGYP